MFRFPEHMTVKKDDFCSLVSWTFTRVKTALKTLKVHNFQTLTFPYTSVVILIDMDLKDGFNLREREKKKWHCVTQSDLGNTSTSYN